MVSFCPELRTTAAEDMSTRATAAAVGAGIVTTVVLVTASIVATTDTTEAVCAVTVSLLPSTVPLSALMSLPDQLTVLPTNSMPAASRTMAVITSEPPTWSTADSGVRSILAGGPVVTSTEASPTFPSTLATTDVCPGLSALSSPALEMVAIEVFVVDH
ncbi:MAG: hypothetical protein JWO05_1062 [Gemmatimonadetes bacterium]|nr:hypothetical protein [Gemmatimonadota bacterium]